MPVIKYDVTGSDPDRALQNFEPPKPGVYLAKIKECNPHLAKGQDGKPDKSRPSLEVILSIETPGDFKGSQLWDYVSLSEEAKWKMDQFLMAVGQATKTERRKGQFKTEDQIGKLVKVRVVADTGEGKTPYGGDNYRPRVGALMAATPNETPESGDGDDPFGGGEDDPFANIGDDDSGGEDIFGGGDDDTGTTTTDELDDGYDEMSVPDLRKELNSRGLDHKGAKPALVARLRENDNEEEPF